MKSEIPYIYKRNNQYFNLNLITPQLIGCYGYCGTDGSVFLFLRCWCLHEIPANLARSHTPVIGILSLCLLFHSFRNSLNAFSAEVSVRPVLLRLVFLRCFCSVSTGSSLSFFFFVFSHALVFFLEEEVHLHLTWRTYGTQEVFDIRCTKNISLDHNTYATRSACGDWWGDVTDDP